jgi:hypothetical protein
MCAVMVKFSSPVADHSLLPSLPLQRGPSWRSFCELMKLGSYEVYACDVAPRATQLPTLRRQPLSSYTFV